MSDIFNNCTVYIVRNSILSKRYEFLKKIVVTYGGTLVTMDISPKPTHILFYESFYNKKVDLQRLLKIINVTCDEILSSKVLSVEWLCRSVRAKELLNTEPFEFQLKVLETASDVIALVTM